MLLPSSFLDNGIQNDTLATHSSPACGNSLCQAAVEGWRAWWEAAASPCHGDESAWGKLQVSHCMQAVAPHTFELNSEFQAWDTKLSWPSLITKFGGPRCIREWWEAFVQESHAFKVENFLRLSLGQFRRTQSPFGIYCEVVAIWHTMPASEGQKTSPIQRTLIVFDWIFSWQQ